MSLKIGTRILITNNNQYNGVRYENGDLATVIKDEDILVEVVVDGKGITKLLPHEFGLYTDITEEVKVQELPEGFKASLKFLENNCPESNGSEIICDKYKMFDGEQIECDECWSRHLADLGGAR
jgi:hypothetical protein